MATTYRTGKFGACILAGVTLKITGWTFNDEVDVEEVLDTGGSGFAQQVVGFRRASGEVTAMYRTDTAPAVASPTMSPGSRATLVLHIDIVAGSPTIDIPEIVIQSLPLVVEVAGQTSFSFSYVVDGTWTELDSGTSTNASF